MQYCKTSPDKVRSQTPSAEYDSSLVSEKKSLRNPLFLKPTDQILIIIRAEIKIYQILDTSL